MEMFKMAGRLGVLLVFAVLLSLPTLADVYVFGNTNGSPFATLTLTTTSGTTILTATSQGWIDLTDTSLLEAAGNHNYVVGEGTSTINDFFTFDLAGLSGTVTGATLGVTLGDVNASFEQSLNFGTASNASAYGNFAIDVTDGPATIVPFGLGGTISSDISAAILATQDSFTVDGSLLTTPCVGPHCPVIIHQGNGSTKPVVALDEVGAIQTPEPGTSQVLLVGVLVSAVALSKLLGRRRSRLQVNTLPSH